jgi:hypothetical protein
MQIAKTDIGGDSNIRGKLLEASARGALPTCITNPNPFRYFKTGSEIIRLTVMMYVRFPLALRNVEDMLHERGVDVSHETVRYWWNRFGPLFAADIRKKRSSLMREIPQWRWHLDEVLVRTNVETYYLWRAVDHDGEVLALPMEGGSSMERRLAAIPSRNGVRILCYSLEMEGSRFYPEVLFRRGCFEVTASESHVSAFTPIALSRCSPIISAPSRTGLGRTQALPSNAILNQRGTWCNSDHPQPPPVGSQSCYYVLSLSVTAHRL